MQDIQTSLLGRRISIAMVHPKLPLKVGDQGQIVSVYLVNNEPKYTILMDDGELKDVYAYMFKLVI